MDEPVTPPDLRKRKGEGFELESGKKRKDSEGEEGGPSAAGEATDWPMKIFTSRNGKSELKTGFRFASFDQTSSKAMGHAACSAITASNVLWLLKNPGKHPTSRELDDLIVEGSTKWNLLCANPENRSAFPDGHFDLETVLAAMKPLETVTEKSFVGFFGTESFKCFNEAMSVDKIWEAMKKDCALNGAGVYVVSWKDHFFAMKVEEEAFYVVDSLGARLHPGCKTGYMLKFDSRSLMIEKRKDSLVERCYGKDCCLEFLKTFLAGPVVKNMARMAAKGYLNPSRDYVRVCNALQIEFHYMTAPSSSANGPPPMECSSSGGDDNDGGGHDKSCPSAPTLVTYEADSPSNPIISDDNSIIEVDPIVTVDYRYYNHDKQPSIP